MLLRWVALGFVLICFGDECCRLLVILFLKFVSRMCCWNFFENQNVLFKKNVSIVFGVFPKKVFCLFGDLSFGFVLKYVWSCVRKRIFCFGKT